MGKNAKQEKTKGHVFNEKWLPKIAEEKKRKYLPETTSWALKGREKKKELHRRGHCWKKAEKKKGRHCGVLLF